MTSRSVPADSDRTLPTPRRGRRPSLSLDAVVDAALEILDFQGEDALTFRSLARSLNTGVGSLYHYVASKDELLDRAAERILAGVLAGLELPSDPYDALRTIANGLYTAMGEHRWVGSYLLRDSGDQPSSMLLFELCGQQVMRLDLTAHQRLDAVTTLLSFVVGVGAEIRTQAGPVDADGEAVLEAVAQKWDALDQDSFPFMQSVAAEFGAHENSAQFRAGVDLILAGIEQQAGDHAR